MEWTLTIDSASTSTQSSTSADVTPEDQSKAEKAESSLVDESEAVDFEAFDLDKSKKGSTTDFDRSFTPFTLRWSYGRNVHIPFINLTTENNKIIFYSSAHVGILYDYEEKTMRFLQGHQNTITSISSDSHGKWLVTADTGKDSVIIVWDSERCLPVRTIFDPHGEHGTRLVGMSLNATYLVSVSDKDQTIACWTWTLGEKEPNGVFKVPSQYGKIDHVAFCDLGTVDHFVLTAELGVVFGTWKENTLSTHIQEKAKRAGKLLCSVYPYYSHCVLSTSDNGYLLMWSDVPFTSIYDKSCHPSNNKTLLKTLKLEDCAIPVIKAYKEVVVTGNEFGEVRFYDKMMRILYWVQSFNLQSITAINFHLWDEDSYSKTMQKQDLSYHERNPFAPFTALEKAFDKVLQREKEKLSELKLITKKGLTNYDYPNALAEDIINNVLEEVKDWNLEDYPNTEKYLEAIIKFSITELEKKYSIALVQTEKLIEGFVSSVLQELEDAEEIDGTTQKDAREVAHSVIHEMLQTFVDDVNDTLDHKTVTRELDNIIDKVSSSGLAKEILDDLLDPPDVSILAREMVDDILDATNAEKLVRDLLDDILDTPNAKMLAREVLDDIVDTIDVEDAAACTRQTLESIVNSVLQKMEDKLSIDPQKVVESVVRNLLKNFERKSKTYKDDEEEILDLEGRPSHRIYNRLKALIDRVIEVEKAAGDHRVPSDASLERKPFVVGNFMISTIDGDIGIINFLKNSYAIVLDKCPNPISALDCHLEKQQFVSGNSSGYIVLYNFQKTRTKLLETKINSTKEEAGITSLKFAPSGLFLACGLSDGSFWILDSSVLTPLIKVPHIHVNAPITQICISDNSQWIAHKDEGMRVCLYRCAEPTGREIEFMGKQKTHFKPIRDLMFTRSLEKELHFFSLGEDRMLVEYDLVHSEPDDLKVLLVERIEQSAIPLCMTMYPKFGVENFILIANSEYKFKIFNDDSRMCRKTALGPRFGKPVSMLSILPKRGDKTTQYMVYCCRRLIGIQMLPLDGNPYKAVGMIGHPEKITHMSVFSRNRTLFTAGEGDHAVFMWTINTRAVDIVSHIGGEGLNPYYCLIEGGEFGWLFKEIEDFFYYAQILHEGENTTSERNITSEIPLCEVPDLMRAIGYFPSEHEIGNMLHEIQFWSYSENGKHQKNIGFEDFVKLYVNHQPAFGTTFSTLREAFETFADDTTSEGPMMWRETLTSMLQERAECLSQEQVVKYLQVLIPSSQDTSSSSSSGSNSDESLWEFIPEEITYKIFLEDILGISPAEDEKDSISLKEQAKDQKGKKQDDQITAEEIKEEDESLEDITCTNVECMK